MWLIGDVVKLCHTLDRLQTELGKSLLMASS